jgi:hypothetical protein
MFIENMLHKKSISAELLYLLQFLNSKSEFNQFRLVGGTAIALQLGHRRSIDIDLFSNEKVDKVNLRRLLNKEFLNEQITLTSTNLRAEINGVRLDIYDEWQIPFRKNSVLEDGIRMAALEDLAAFKLSAFTGRREKKDYIDLFFLFKKLGAANVLTEFANYEPLLSPKSVLFALTEVTTAEKNKSPMPDMLMSVSWNEIIESMKLAAKNYIVLAEEKRGKKTSN